MKNKLINIFLILALVAGLSLLLYPTVSDYWNSLHASQAVASYDQAVKSMDEDKYDELLQRAGQYNRDLFLRGSLFALTDEEREDYNSQLDIDGSGVMGYIEIPTIKVSLPIYHGTSDDVLQVAVGHLEWSSLPVGGESTHCVLSGHRGLPSAKLFTNLDQLAEGDLFVIRTLDEVLTYEVDRILIVLPSELQALAAEEGKDLCTLVTCTPYGVNSHRMLVRGHRVDNQSEAVRLTADAIRIDPLLVAPIAAIPLLLALLLLLAVAPKKKSRDDT
ncbi:MAG: class C sortase [Oscillospiraceae bacterium]